MGLTVTQISKETAKRFGRNTPYFIPATFLYRQKRGITPRLCQIVALSEITGYRFCDWMSVCGFDLKMVLALQLRIHSERTVIVTPDPCISTRVASLVPCDRSYTPSGRYLFAKIGRRDAVVYPQLVPGSIIRADQARASQTAADAGWDQRLWLVEHGGGLTCCYVKPVGAQHVVLLPNRPPLSAWPLRLSQEARILGLVDLELRPQKASRFCPMRSSGLSDVLQPPQHDSCGVWLSRLLRSARCRSGLTLRAAHQMTMRIAELLDNREYSIALGLLSDYEAINKVPRHVAKIISLCVVYGIDPNELAMAAGIRIRDGDKQPLLPDFYTRSHSNAA